MLKDERLTQIVNLVNRRKTICTEEIVKLLHISPATVRRDLNELNQAGRLKKIYGGAKALNPIDYVTTEDGMGAKIQSHMKEKIAIAECAAQIIQDHDFVYLDAGTSVEAMLGFIQAWDLSFVTNSLTIARELSAMQYRVLTLPGEIKISTDSIVGIAAGDYLQRFNFTVGFFGTNGVHRDFGYTTPDINEALVKEAAIARCRKAYILADQGKFGKVSQVTFCKDAGVSMVCDSQDEDGMLKARILTLEALT